MPKLKNLCQRLLRHSKRAMPLSLLLLGALSLAACKAPTTGTAAEVAYACSLYGQALTYSGSKDTLETIREVIAKNKTFLDANCDLKGGVKK